MTNESNFTVWTSRCCYRRWFECWKKYPIIVFIRVDVNYFTRLRAPSLPRVSLSLSTVSSSPVHRIRQTIRKQAHSDIVVGVFSCKLVIISIVILLMLLKYISSLLHLLTLLWRTNSLCMCARSVNCQLLLYISVYLCALFSLFLNAELPFLFARFVYDSFLHTFKVRAHKDTMKSKANRADAAHSAPDEQVFFIFASFEQLEQSAKDGKWRKQETRQ